jgi:hypothetical protein
MATASSTAPQKTVVTRARRSDFRSLMPRAGARKKSTTTVEDSEFRAALRLAMAAARMAAISSPASPWGRWFQMKSG